VADHNDPNAVNSIFSDIDVSAADLYDIFGFPSDDLSGGEKEVAHQLTRGLLPAQAKPLDALLTKRDGISISGLAWARQPLGAPGHRALARLVAQRGMLSAIAIDPATRQDFSTMLRRSR
jgi:hypothetical protein